jgi:hypothetical protein
MSASLSVQESRVSRRFLSSWGHRQAALQFDQKLAARHFDR